MPCEVPGKRLNDVKNTADIKEHSHSVGAFVQMIWYCNKAGCLPQHSHLLVGQFKV